MPENLLKKLTLEELTALRDEQTDQRRINLVNEEIERRPEDDS